MCCYKCSYTYYTMCQKKDCKSVFVRTSPKIIKIGNLTKTILHSFFETWCRTVIIVIIFTCQKVDHKAYINALKVVQQSRWNSMETY